MMRLCLNIKRTRQCAARKTPAELTIARGSTSWKISNEPKTTEQQTVPIPSDTTVDSLTPEETIGRKRATLDGTESDHDARAVGCWRSDEFVAMTSVDWLAGSWLSGEHGNDDEVTAGDTCDVDCPGASVALDKQANVEATEEALDSLLPHGAVEDMNRSDATHFKFSRFAGGKAGA